MKKILLILVVFMFTTPMFSQVTLSSRDSITTFYPYDIMMWQEWVAGTYKNRQMSWSILRGLISGYLDGISLTWASPQTFSGIATFNGADFDAGSHGGVTFSDSVDFQADIYLKNLFPLTDDTYRLGLSRTAARWFIIQAKYGNFEYLTIYNQEGNDSTVFTFDDSLLTIDRDISIGGALTITESFTLDSAATIGVLNFESHLYTIPNVGDTTLGLSTADAYSVIELDLPGDMDPGISKMQVDGAGKGMILRFYNADATYDAVFLDLVSGDDNLYMSGNATLAAGHYDNITFQCVDATKNAQKWMQISESDN